MKYICKYLVFLFSLNFIEGSFRCDYKYSAVAKTWFKHFVIPANWYDARLRCEREGAILASPTTLEIQREMTRIMKEYFNSESEVFTGISASLSQGDFYTIEGTPFSELSLAWADTEPDNVFNEERCMTMNIYAEVFDKPCMDTNPYICYRPENEVSDKNFNECGTVDPEYYLDSRTNSCYKFHKVPRNYSRAYLTCSAEGGHLAIINSELEAKVLKELFAKYPAENIVGDFYKNVAYVGFHASYEPLDWKTVHDETLEEAGYNKFSPGEPNIPPPGLSCGGMYRTGLLDDLKCHRFALFICEKNPNVPAICKHT